MKNNNFRNNFKNNNHHHNPKNYESVFAGNKIKGTAEQIYDKYLTLSRDALSQGDMVLAESYLQYSDHYARLIDQFRSRQSQSHTQHTSTHTQQVNNNNVAQVAPVSPKPEEVRVAKLDESAKPTSGLSMTPHKPKLTPKSEVKLDESFFSSNKIKELFSVEIPDTVVDLDDDEAANLLDSQTETSIYPEAETPLTQTSVEPVKGVKKRAPKTTEGVRRLRKKESKTPEEEPVV